MIEYITNNANQLTNNAIRIFLCFAVFWFFFKLIKSKGKEIYQNLKGADNKLDLPELAGIVWVFLFVLIVVADVLLEVKINEGVLIFVEVLGINIMGGRVLLDAVKNKKL